MNVPWDPNSENKYQTLLQTKRDLYTGSMSRPPQSQQFDKEMMDNNQLRVDRERQYNAFSNNSSQILNNQSIPVNIYPVNQSQFQVPPSQMGRGDMALDEKTRRKQADLLSASYQGPNQVQGGNASLDINNYMKNQNNDDSSVRPMTNARSMLNSRMVGDRSGNPYGSELKQQILIRETEKKNAKLREKLLEQKLLVDRYNNDWFGKQGSGAPIRDQFGNIITSRKKPTNPNYMSSDWNNPLPSRGTNQLTTSMPNLNLNEISMMAQMNNNEGGNQGNEQLPQINVIAPQGPQQDSLDIIQKQSISPPNINFTVPQTMDLEAFNRREREKLAQQENFQIMEAKRKEKEDERLLKKREAELIDLKIQKEREEQEARRMFEYGNTKLESKNLYETNFDLGKLMGKTSRVNFMPNRTLREVQTTTRTEKSSKRPRTPIEEVEQEMRELRNREENLKIQQRLMQELPIEVSKTVQNTVDVEMMKLKNELNFQQNLLGEQIMSLKGDLLRSNEMRQESEREVKKLQKEIQKTQLVDEIRQRELYMALILKNRKPNIYHTITQRLEEPEVTDFKFPERPKPYYNVYDPSIEDIEFRNRDLNEIINNRTELIPMGIQEERIVKGNNWDQSRQEVEKYAYGITLDNEKMPNLPDDYANLQGVNQPRIIEDGEQVYYLDTYNANMRRLESLEQNNPREELEKLDYHLFNLLNNANKGKGTFDDLNREINQYSAVSDIIKINDRNADYFD